MSYPSAMSASWNEVLPACIIDEYILHLMHCFPLTHTCDTDDGACRYLVRKQIVRPQPLSEITIPRVFVMMIHNARSLLKTPFVLEGAIFEVTPPYLVIENSNCNPFI